MSEKRSKTIMKSGYLFILINILLSIFNIVVGLVSNSLAIISDALHSLIDAISGILIIVTEKIAGLKKYAKNREKIERIATIIIAIIIILVGFHIIHESIEKILEPDDVDYSLPTIIVLIASILTKYLLADYLKKTGHRIKSTVVAASGAETMNDCFISVAVLISAIIYLVWHIDIEAYLSIAIALIIFKIGLEFIFPHLSRHHHHHLESDPDHDHCRRK
ncbi:MAG: cation diffusion facilitator family transporter [Candidatus Saccharibacteria bacterium]|nr:cation diffusion facilitator family transporter [Candidatus Saccharibacteria bacterium]